MSVVLLLSIGKLRHPFPSHDPCCGRIVHPKTLGCSRCDRSYEAARRINQTKTLGLVYILSGQMQQKDRLAGSGLSDNVGVE